MNIRDVRPEDLGPQKPTRVQIFFLLMCALIVAACFIMGCGFPPKSKYGEWNDYLVPSDSHLECRVVEGNPIYLQCAVPGHRRPSP